MKKGECMSMFSYVQEISVDSRRSYCLQLPELLERYVILPEDRELLKLSVQEFSRKDPLLAEHLIVLPFVVQFGKYMREVSNCQRWPTLGEVSRSMELVLEGYVDPEFLEKKTRVYTVRKYAERVVSWKKCLAERCGTLRTNDRVLDIKRLADEYVTYTTGTLFADKMMVFAQYVLEQTSGIHEDLRGNLASSIVHLYRAGV